MRPSLASASPPAILESTHEPPIAIAALSIKPDTAGTKAKSPTDKIEEPKPALLKSAAKPIDEGIKSTLKPITRYTRATPLMTVRAETIASKLGGDTFLEKPVASSSASKVAVSTTAEADEFEEPVSLPRVSIPHEFTPGRTKSMRRTSFRRRKSFISKASVFGAVQSHALNLESNEIKSRVKEQTNSRFKSVLSSQAAALYVIKGRRRLWPQRVIDAICLYLIIRCRWKSPR
jgi:hypothetical protein